MNIYQIPLSTFTDDDIGTCSVQLLNRKVQHINMLIVRYLCLINIGKFNISV